MLIKDIVPGPTSSAPSYFTAYGGLACFVADDIITGSELWRTDGRPGGTFMVEDIEGGDSAPYLMTGSGPFLFFAANNATVGRELFATDLLFKDGVELGP